MVTFTPVDFNPFEGGPTLTPVDFDPFDTSISGSIAERFKNPPNELSLIGMARGLYDALQVPGKVAKGEYSPQPETPGMETEEDVFRRDISANKEVADALKVNLATLLGSIPAVSRGTLGTGAARPGVAQPTPPATPPLTPSPIGAVVAAERQGVQLPRYLIDEDRMTQGLAAGLQNIPGAGSKIAETTNKVVQQLGGAATNVKEGFGAGSPGVAGSAAKDAIENWIGPGSKKIAERVYDSVDSLVNPNVTTELRATAAAAQGILTRRANASIPGRSSAVDSVMEAVTKPGGLNYHGLKDLRTFIGDMTPQELIAQNLKGSEVKQLYQAMTHDLRRAAQRGGGERGLAAFDRANTVFEQIATRRESMTKLIGTKGDASPEAVYSRLIAWAGSKSSADASRLQLARKTMGPEAWNEVASAAVSRLGRDPQGEFSVPRFLTAYGNLSPRGRMTLFKTTGRDDLGRSLEDINRVSSHVQERLQRFSNPSGTGRSVTATAVVGGLLTSPLETLATLVGGNKLAAVLSQPATARAAANWMREYQAAVTPMTRDSERKIRIATDQFAEVLARFGISGIGVENVPSQP